MINDKKLLAIIPARSGSKRLPNKNILPLNGKPLIQWSIDAAINSSFIDAVVVSTDSIEIADIAEKGGARVPFIRPAELSSDESTSIDVVLHAINELGSKGEYFNYVMLLQPTSPLRTEKHIDESVQLLLSKGAKAVVSVCRITHPIEWTGEIQDDLSMDAFIKNIEPARRAQDFPDRYSLNGSIYLVSVPEFVKYKKFAIDQGCFAYKMEPESSVDIDEQLDFEVCEMIMSKEYNHKI